MKNLIEEIEKMKNRGGWTNDEFYKCGINDCLEILNQYNLITAPKSIKLSEIVSKIQEHSNKIIYFNKELETIGYGEYDEDWMQNTWQPFVTFKDMKILRIYISMAESTRWLYTLWIAGTEIIDDLEELK